MRKPRDPIKERIRLRRFYNEHLKVKPRPCVICQKIFQPVTSSITCSKECREENEIQKTQCYGFFKRVPRGVPPNHIHKGAVVEIQCTNGEWAIFDKADGFLILHQIGFGELSCHQSTRGRGLKYVVFWRGRSAIRVHRFLLDVTDPKTQVDHWDGNGLNNRRYNLRACTAQQNCRNQRQRLSRCSSKYKGVWKHQHSYRASITISYRSIHLGCFNSEVEAAKVYDEAARLHFGAFARVNFPNPGEMCCLEKAI